jgi:hypothetical protein
MTRQNIATGTSANDGTGDTLRSAGTKINDNFVELYRAFGTDSNLLTTGITFDSAKIVIAGTTNTTTLSRFDPSEDVEIKFPDSNGKVVVMRPDSIVNLQDSNGDGAKIYYANVFDSANGYGVLPSAHTYHGMFAMNHDNGRAVFAHDNHWHNLLDSDSFTSIVSLELTTPKIDSKIFDTTGTFEVFELNNTSTGNTSYVKVSNVSDSAPIIEAVGTSANIGLKIASKGTELINLDGALKFETVSYNTGQNLDSNASSYVFATAGPQTFTLHDGRYTGEVKKLVNRSIQDITIFAGTNNIRTPGNNLYSSMVLTDVNFVNIIWDGAAWILDRDSDKYITFS